MTPTPVATTFYTRDGTSVGRALVRRVWAALTQTPGSSGRELSERLSISRRSAYNALTVLCDAGYITTSGKRAWRVLIPFYTPLRPELAHHTPERAAVEETTPMHSIPEPPQPEPIIVCTIGAVKVLGFAPNTVRVEGNTDALSPLAHQVLDRAVEATLDALKADQRARAWGKVAAAALSRGEPVPAYHVGKDL